jgi:tripartite ATP-independent transporter DctM subunit
MSAVTIAIFLLLMFFGIPVAFALGISCFFVFLFAGNFTPMLLAHPMVFGIDKFVLLAVPSFILAGKLMNEGGMTRRIFRLAGALVGHISGGIAHVNIVASMIFAGMSGAAIADAAGLGVIEIEAMKEEGFPIDFSAAVTAASSSVGPIIPPSIVMVLYGFVGGVSIGRLLLGGILPGLIMGISLMGITYVFALKRGFSARKRANVHEFIKSLKEAVFPLITPVIIIGGILGGVFTPTEAAIVAACYTALIGVIVYREIRWAGLRRVLLETAQDTAIIIFILAVSSVFSWILTTERIPVVATDFIFSLSSNPKIILLLLNIFFLFLGCFVDAAPIIFIMTPILMPLLYRAGIDPVHFGVVFILNLTIGVLTPPFGMVMFIVCNIARISMIEYTKAMLPFL